MRRLCGISQQSTWRASLPLSRRACCCSTSTTSTAAKGTAHTREPQVTATWNRGAPTKKRRQHQRMQRQEGGAGRSLRSTPAGPLVSSLDPALLTESICTLSAKLCKTTPSASFSTLVGSGGNRIDDNRDEDTSTRLVSAFCDALVHRMVEDHRRGSKGPPQPPSPEGLDILCLTLRGAGHHSTVTDGTIDERRAAPLYSRRHQPVPNVVVLPRAALPKWVTSQPIIDYHVALRLFCLEAPLTPRQSPQHPPSTSPRDPWIPAVKGGDGVVKPQPLEATLTTLSSLHDVLRYVRKVKVGHWNKTRRRSEFTVCASAMLRSPVPAALTTWLEEDELQTLLSDRHARRSLHRAVESRLSHSLLCFSSAHVAEALIVRLYLMVVQHLTEIVVATHEMDCATVAATHMRKLLCWDELGFSVGHRSRYNKHVQQPSTDASPLKRTSVNVLPIGIPIRTSTAIAVVALYGTSLSNLCVGVPRSIVHRLDAIPRATAGILIAVGLHLRSLWHREMHAPSPIDNGGTQREDRYKNRRHSEWLRLICVLLRSLVPVSNSSKDVPAAVVTRWFDAVSRHGSALVFVPLLALLAEPLEHIRCQDTLSVAALREAARRGSDAAATAAVQARGASEDDVPMKNRQGKDHTQWLLWRDLIGTLQHTIRRLTAELAFGPKGAEPLLRAFCQTASLGDGQRLAALVNDCVSHNKNLTPFIGDELYSRHAIDFFQFLHDWSLHQVRHDGFDSDAAWSFVFCKFFLVSVSEGAPSGGGIVSTPRFSDDDDSVVVDALASAAASLKHRSDEFADVGLAVDNVATVARLLLVESSSSPVGSLSPGSVPHVMRPPVARQPSNASSSCPAQRRGVESLWSKHFSSFVSSFMITAAAQESPPTPPTSVPLVTAVSPNGLDRRFLAWLDRTNEALMNLEMFGAAVSDADDGTSPTRRLDGWSWWEAVLLPPLGSVFQDAQSCFQRVLFHLNETDHRMGSSVSTCKDRRIAVIRFAACVVESVLRFLHYCCLRLDSCSVDMLLRHFECSGTRRMTWSKPDPKGVATFQQLLSQVLFWEDVSAGDAVANHLSPMTLLRTLRFGILPSQQRPLHHSMEGAEGGKTQLVGAMSRRAYLHLCREALSRVVSHPQQIVDDVARHPMGQMGHNGLEETSPKPTRCFWAPLCDAIATAPTVVLENRVAAAVRPPTAPEFMSKAAWEFLFTACAKVGEQLRLADDVFLYALATITSLLASSASATTEAALNPGSALGDDFPRSDGNEGEGGVVDGLLLNDIRDALLSEVLRPHSHPQHLLRFFAASDTSSIPPNIFTAMPSLQCRRLETIRLFAWSRAVMPATSCVPRRGTAALRTQQSPPAVDVDLLWSSASIAAAPTIMDVGVPPAASLKALLSLLSPSVRIVEYTAAILSSSRCLRCGDAPSGNEMHGQTFIYMFPNVTPTTVVVRDALISSVLRSLRSASKLDDETSHSPVVQHVLEGWISVYTSLRVVEWCDPLGPFQPPRDSCCLERVKEGKPDAEFLERVLSALGQVSVADLSSAWLRWFFVFFRSCARRSLTRGRCTSSFPDGCAHLRLSAIDGAVAAFARSLLATTDRPLCREKEWLVDVTLLADCVVAATDLGLAHFESFTCCDRHVDGSSCCTLDTFSMLSGSSAVQCWQSLHQLLRLVHTKAVVVLERADDRRSVSETVPPQGVGGETRDEEARRLRYAASAAAVLRALLMVCWRQPATVSSRLKSHDPRILPLLPAIFADDAFCAAVGVLPSVLDVAIVMQLILDVVRSDLPVAHLAAFTECVILAYEWLAQIPQLSLTTERQHAALVVLQAAESIYHVTRDSTVGSGITLSVSPDRGSVEAPVDELTSIMMALLRSFPSLRKSE